ncbi:MAG TPA: AMP-binding protein [Acidimicrobiales bacterium]|nr:AMP-binding protein [Acidimicrobiales bacterium]
MGAGVTADSVEDLARRAGARGWVSAPTLWGLIERRAEATPGGLLAHDDAGRRLTFAQFHEASLRAAAGLHADHGVGRGTGVSWELPTWNESLVLVGALARLGARQNPLIPIYRGREVGFITGQSRASLLVVPTVYRGFDFEAMAREIAADRPGLAVLVVDRRLPEGDPTGLPPAEDPPTRASEAPIRWLFYTSGTTADPKGAPHSDLTVMASALAMAECLDIQPDDVSALVFPFTHIGGIGWLIASLFTGCTLLTTESFDPTATPRFLAAGGVTLAGSGTPFHMAYLSAQRAAGPDSIFPHVRSYPGGGAPKPPQLHYDLKQEIGGVGIVSGYGLTEAPIVVMATTDDPDEKLATTEGRPTPGVDLVVVGLDGRRAGPGVEGEIRLKGPQVIGGYLDPSLDADAFDDEGYFRSGDLGTVDDEGYVTITGRLKDVIIRHGENISAKEVEDLLYAHPALADVAVIGLPDPTTGERACAVVAVREGSTFGFEEMVSFLRGQNLRVQAIPEQLEVVPVVPRNPAGKILKHTLREQFAPAPEGSGR